MHKFVFRIKDRIALSTGVGRLVCGLQRAFSPWRGESGEPSPLPGVALNFYRLHLAEHLADLLEALKKHKFLAPLVAVPLSPFSPLGRGIPWKEYEKKFGLEFGKTLLPSIWLSRARPRVFIESSITAQRGLVGSAIKVLSYHGLACMGFGKDSRRVLYLKDYDYLFLSGPPQREAILLAHRRYGGSLPHLLEVGYMLGDRLLARKESFHRQGFLESLGLDSRITVLYAPTWGRFSSLGLWLEKVVRVCLRLEFNLLLRLHPLSLRGRTGFERGPKAWRKWLEEACKKYEWVKDVTDEPIEEVLLGADVLVTDVSSVGMDFLILGKPAIFLPSPGFFENFGTGFPVEKFRKGREVVDEEELGRALEKGAKGGLEPSPPLEEMVYNPGRATQRAVAFLEEIVGV